MDEFLDHGDTQSTLDKVLILRTVPMFSESPDETLVEITAILEEVDVPAGQTIFQQGDLGSSMYIIVEGRVAVEVGGRVVNSMAKGEFFGEMTALDPEPRSASIIAIEDTQLFRIDQRPLYDLMTGRTEVLRGVVHVLCQRLRARTRDLADEYEYMQQFAKVTSAAAAIEAGIFQPASLDGVAQRTDELGQLARVFQRMARQVAAREQQLKQQVQELRIEIDLAKQARQVSEITEADSFQELQRKALELRRRRAAGPPPPKTP